MHESNLWIEIARTTLPSIVVGVGWFVANKLTAEREQKNSRKLLVLQELDSIGKDVAELTGVVITYHSADRSLKLEREINVSFQDITQRVTRVGSRVDIIGRSAELIRRAIEFKKTGTLRHFEDDHNSPLTESDPLLQEITAASYRLRESIARAKFEAI